MDKETSSRVSSIAGTILAQLRRNPDHNSIAISREDAEALAGSALSQDQTPGQAAPKGDFLSRLKDEREDLERRLIALNSYLSNNPGKPYPRHASMLVEQAKLMSDLLAVIDERLADIGISQRSELSGAEGEDTDAEGNDR
jgi:uncharacterized protein YjiS (DUF1127 family)